LRAPELPTNWPFDVPSAAELEDSALLFKRAIAEWDQMHKTFYNTEEMKFFPLPTPLVLYSDFSPEECALRLSKSIDVEKPTMFGFSGYKGAKPFLGEVDGKRFRLIQRVYRNRNTLPPVLTGEFEPEGSGTRVKGQFDLEQTAKVAICLLGFFGLFVLALIAALSYAAHPALTIGFVCGYGGLLVFSPRIFRGIGLDQEKSVARFLQETLVATDVFSPPAAGRD
jgi:hypothetical protein